MGIELDRVDEDIIALLRANGRVSNVEIARNVGMSEGAIRKRLDRLISEDFVRVVAVTNHYKTGYLIDTFVALDADFDKVTSIAQMLSSIEQVRFVATAVGVYSIVCAVSFRSRDDIFHFVQEELASIPGIRKVDVHLLNVVKRDYDWVYPDLATS